MLLSFSELEKRKVFLYDSGRGITLGTYPWTGTLHRTHPGIITVCIIYQTDAEMHTEFGWETWKGKNHWETTK
jgi:hypothetical protein